MIKKIATLSLTMIMLFTLGACGNSQLPSKDTLPSTPESKDIDTSESSESEQDSTVLDSSQTEANAESSVLIAYFSWSGNTKQLAEVIQEQTGGELFEIAPETPYTDDINKLSGIALQEQRNNARPALASHVDDMKKYDVVFVGYPNWWNNMPMPVFTFLEEYDFSGKTVVPFTTYGDGVFGKSINSLKETLPNATIVDGLAIQEHELEDASKEVIAWLKELGIAK
jgi:putative flavodoxin